MVWIIINKLWQVIIHHIPAACSSTTVRHRKRGRELEHEQGKWEVGFTQWYRRNGIEKKDHSGSERGLQSGEIACPDSWGMWRPVMHSGAVSESKWLEWQLSPKGDNSLEQLRSFVSQTSLSREKIIPLGQECWKKRHVGKKIQEMVSLAGRTEYFQNSCRQTSREAAHFNFHPLYSSWLNNCRNNLPF